MLSIAAIAPNLPQYIPCSLLQKVGLARPASINTIVWRMEKQGLVQMVEVKGKRVPRITERGRREMYSQSDFLSRMRKKKWDGKWRIIIFDIPQKFNTTRDKIRRELIAVGFYRLQHSVWVFPYPCEEYIALLKADQRVGRDMLYIIADTIEHDRNLREMFDLPPADNS